MTDRMAHAERVARELGLDFDGELRQYMQTTIVQQDVRAEREGDEALRKELVQVAAVAVAWAEAIDERTRRSLAAEEHAAVRAAVHQSYSGDGSFDSCRDLRLDSCFDAHHHPAIVLDDWWPA